MYKISESELAGNKIFTLKHLPTGNYASVVAGYGSALNEFVVNGRHILLAATNETEFNLLTKKAFAGNQLFPYPNRVNHARYFYEDQHFTLPKNDSDGRPNALHGLIYDIPFETECIDELNGILQLSYQFEGIPGVYPFSMVIKVTYQLTINSITIKSTIFNTGTTVAPLGYGWHPYFNVYGSMRDCTMQIPSTTYYMVDDNLIPTGQTSQLNHFEKENTIGDLELNHCFKILPNYNVTTIRDAGYQIDLKQEGYAYTQFYIPPDRKSIAVEPQTCVANALNNDIGLIHLEPGNTLDLSFQITATKLT